MTVVQEPIKRLRLYEEPNGSFATDHSGTMGDFIGCPFVEGSLSFSLNRAVLPVGHSQQHIDGMAEKVLGIKTWELSYQMNMETVDTKAGNGVTIAQGALGRMLKIGMGGERLGVGDTFAVSAGTNAFDVTTGARWVAGSAIAGATGAGNALEVRVIESISSNTVTLKHNFTETTVNTETAWNSATYYLETGDGDTITSAQFALEGLEQDDRWLLMGGQLTGLAIEAGPGIVPTMTFTWQGVDWDYADGTDTSGTLTGSTLGIETYADAKPLVVKDSELRVFTNGTATLTSTLIDAPAYTFAPNIQHAAHFAPGGTETVKTWIRLHQPPVISGTIQRPYEGTGWKDAMEGLTNLGIFLQIGTSTTDGAVCIDVPTVQVTNWQRVDIGGIAGEEITWEARQDSDVGSSVTDIALSAFRVHIV